MRLLDHLYMVLMRRKASVETNTLGSLNRSDQKTNYCELRLLEQEGVFQFGNNEEKFETARVLFQL